MKFYVGVTDGEWFAQLARLKPDEVNFWRPGGHGSFRALEPSQPFLFKLHSPRNFIVGGGFFVSYSRLPVSIAWLAFGQKNGVADAWAFKERIRKYRREATSPDPTIGCIVLTEPFFFPEEQWIPVKDWSPNIVQGKGYSTNEPLGQALWDEVRLRLEVPPAAQQAPPYQPSLLDSPLVDRYGQPYLARARLGQGAFRVLVTDAYARRCAVTGEKTLPVLEAAHIKPYAQSGPHSISNGLLLRADLHILFDRGYVTVDPELRVQVSRKIKEEYENGRDYYALEGQPLRVVPSNQQHHPNQSFLSWHNEHVFVP